MGEGKGEREQCTREERYKGDATRRKVSEAARAASSKRRRRPPRGERYNREKERERKREERDEARLAGK